MVNDSITDTLSKNLNFFLEDFGIAVNTTHVLRTVYFKKYNHPKETLIQNGIVNDDLQRIIRGLTKNTTNFGNDDENMEQKVCNIVQPQGVTLASVKPSFVVMNSGPVSYPTNKPLCALYVPRNKQGRLCVIGSTKIFEDEYIDREENAKLFDTLIS